jgi:hypothetical protein
LIFVNKGIGLLILAALFLCLYNNKENQPVRRVPVLL